MAVYVDGLRDWGWRLGPSCHLVTDGDIEELHTFAARLGMRRSWFQPGRNGRHPHYDLTASRRAKAIELGAVEIDAHELLDVLARTRAAN